MSRRAQAGEFDVDDARGPRPPLSRWWTPLKPFIDAVAALPASVQLKLLSGFLIGALLLLGMAVLSFVVIQRMSDRVHEINTLEKKVDLARQMKYDITVQSHLRAMALLTGDPKYNQDVLSRKASFAASLDAVQKISGLSDRRFYNQVRTDNAVYTNSGGTVAALYTASQPSEAQTVHLTQEHPQSHVLEAEMDRLTAQSLVQMDQARAAFDADRRLLLTTVAGAAATSLVMALLLGLTLSGAFIRPVRQVDTGLARIARGDFDTQVQVRNHDEFGTLARNVNVTATRLSSLYGQLQALNASLEERVTEQLHQLERASGLRRYLSPQLAESIMAGNMVVGEKPQRRNLTVLVVELREFVSLAQRVEPDELIDMLNEYLTALTEIVFEHGGTLDKYIGADMMCFFGDPIPLTDHPIRAVQAALRIREEVAALQKRWNVIQQPLDIGVGISTGYITVGHVGSPSRLDYTVIGNHVNLAQLLAQRAKTRQILVSERTLIGVQDYVEAGEVFNVRLQGVSRRLKVYEINERKERQVEEDDEQIPRDVWRSSSTRHSPQPPSQ